jgi:hypothetical protein
MPTLFELLSDDGRRHLRIKEFIGNDLAHDVLCPSIVALGTTFVMLEPCGTFAGELL